MPRAVRVNIDIVYLRELLGLRHTDIKVAYAAINHGVYQRPVLELLLEGEDLPDDFMVDSGTVIRYGDLVIEGRSNTGEIKPL